MTPENHLAIRKLRKTETRRLSGLEKVNEEPDKWELAGKDWFHAMIWKTAYIFHHKDTKAELILKPRYHVGETVYVKETWRVMASDDSSPPSDISSENRCLVDYKLGNSPSVVDCILGKWRSPLFMPAWAARDFIRITDVKPQRLQEITLEDCWDEGIRILPAYDRIDAYHKLWDSIDKNQKWDINPWVWRYCFEKVESK